MKKYILLFLLFPILLFADENKYYHTKINNADVYIISLKDFLRDTNILIPDDKKAEETIKKTYPDGKYITKTNVVIVKKGKRNILVDTGYPDTIDSLKKALNVAGLEFKDITDVIFSHVHFDHIGGMVYNNKPLFPKAQIYINKYEYDYFFNKAKDKSAETAKKLLAPYKNNIKLYTEGIIDNSFKEITAVAGYGHTPGHTVIKIKDNKKEVLFLADIFHCYDVQMKHPKTAVIYDVDKEKAVKSRIDIMNKYKNTDTLITGAHTPFTIPVKWK